MFAQVRTSRVGVDREHPVQKIRPSVQQAARPRELDTRAAVDHVASERERASGEAEQRQAAVERALDLGHRIEDVTQAVLIGRFESGDRGFVGQRMLEARTLAFTER